MKVLVTGTSRGLGYGIAEELVAKGIEVIGCSRGSCNLPIKHISGVDFSKIETLDILRNYLSECDGLINNAAVAFDGLIATQSEESIYSTIQINLISSSILIKRYVRERLAVKKGGNIINISSIVGKRGYSGLAIYSATKAGLDGMTRSLARELGPRKFRVNSVLPGYMETELSKGLSIDQKKQIIRRTPLGRLASIFSALLRG